MPGNSPPDDLEIAPPIFAGKAWHFFGGWCLEDPPQLVCFVCYWKDGAIIANQLRFWRIVAQRWVEDTGNLVGCESIQHGGVPARNQRRVDGNLFLWRSAAFFPHQTPRWFKKGIAMSDHFFLGMFVGELDTVPSAYWRFFAQHAPEAQDSNVPRHSDAVCSFCANFALRGTCEHTHVAFVETGQISLTKARMPQWKTKSTPTSHMQDVDIILPGPSVPAEPSSAKWLGSPAIYKTWSKSPFGRGNYPILRGLAITMVCKYSVWLTMAVDNFPVIFHHANSNHPWGWPIFVESVSLGSFQHIGVFLGSFFL